MNQETNLFYNLLINGDYGLREWLDEVIHSDVSQAEKQRAIIDIIQGMLVDVDPFIKSVVKSFFFRVFWLEIVERLEREI